ncbi:MAG: hypothetical protein HC837_04880 [Chloroflexaceae bacterium]|nr:hypothetical protein [Chloroflexaceae bacterium]
MRRTIRSLWHQHGIYALFYLSITLLYTYPALLHMNNALVGEGWDGLLNLWNIYWLGHAIETGQYPYYTTLMYYPFGTPLYFHTYNALGSLVVQPISWCCGLAPAYNVLIWLTLWASCLGAYALAFFVTQWRGASFVAGLIYGFSPYMALHLSVGQPHLLSLQWLPLTVLALLIGLRQDRRLLLLAALFLVCSALSEWHYTIYAVLFTAIIGLYEVVLAPTWQRRITIVLSIALVGALAALLLTPVLVPMLIEAASSPYAARGLDDNIYHSTDVLAFLLPSIYHPLWGDWAGQRFHGGLVPTFIVGGVATLGFLPLVLGLCALFGALRRSRLFLILFAICVVLALGPYLQINGQNSYFSANPIPLPYLLLHQLPFFNIHRVPSRFVAGAMLALAVLAAIGLQWLVSQRFFTAKRPLLRHGLVVLVVLIVLFEYWPRPFALTPVSADKVTPFFQQLADDPEPYAVLEVPHLDNFSLFYQTHHTRPIVGGTISRSKGHPWSGARFFGALLDARPVPRDVGLDDSPSAIRSALRCQGIRYVLFYQQRVDAYRLPDITRLEQRLFAQHTPVYEDSMLRVYEVERERPAEPYWTLAPDEWYDADTNPSGILYRWAIGTHGSLFIRPCVADAGSTHATAVSFNLYSFDQERQISLTLQQQLLTTIDMPRETPRRISLLLPVRAGEQRLELRSQQPALSPEARGYTNDPRNISFNLSQVDVYVLRKRE